MELNWLHDFHAIKDRGLHLLQTEKWANCHFLVGTSPHQKIIAGHKLILAMASPVFERMFYGQFANNEDPIVIPDVQPDAFQAMLKYIYSDRIKIVSFDKACELRYVAEKYMLPHVVKQCKQYLWANLSLKNACRAYEFAKLFNETRLMKLSMQLISCNTREVLADPSFTNIEVSTLMAILDQDKLNIDSELDLFNALLRFSIDNDKNSPVVGVGGLLHVEEIKMKPDVNENNDVSYHHHAPSPDVVVVDSDASFANASETEEAVAAASTPSSPSNNQAAATAANLNYFMDAQRLIIDEAMLRKAVKKIRFLTMTPQQFAEGPARSKLLEQNDALAILIKITSLSINDCPMPEGFCTSCRNRN